MNASRIFVRAALLYLVVVTTAAAGDARRVQVSADSDARAIEIAQSVMQAMGGWEAWDATRFVSWRFFGGRLHHWDRATGDIRIENVKSRQEEGTFLILMNIHSRQGRVWRDDSELAGEQLAAWLERGHQYWVNDSYWMFMPYKLLDPGVTLKYGGAGTMEDGRASDVLELTFADGVGYTPQNRYHVHVARDSGLVEQWDFYADAADAEPRFKMPWSDWKPFGRIRLATGHGRENDWEIAVHERLPRSVFDSPEPIGR